MKICGCFLAMLLVGSSAYAADAFFVRFSTNSGPNGVLRWADDILFYNTNISPVTVHFVGVSNGIARPGAPDLLLPARKTLSLRGANEALIEQWAPAFPPPPMWILHLDIPPGVIVESRDAFYRIVEFGGVGLVSVTPRGKVSMPIFRTLIPPNEPQVQLGTDLGGRDSRINVGIYNAGDAPATATVEVRRSCDDVVVATATIGIPQNTVIQAVGVAAAVQQSECTGTATAPEVYTVTTTVDQPSFTFVSNVTGDAQQSTDEAGIFPVVTLAVSKNERF